MCAICRGGHDVLVRSFYTIIIYIFFGSTTPPQTRSDAKRESYYRPGEDESSCTPFHPHAAISRIVATLHDFRFFPFKFVITRYLLIANRFCENRQIVFVKRGFLTCTKVHPPHHGFGGANSTPARGLPTQMRKSPSCAITPQRSFPRDG